MSIFHILPQEAWQQLLDTGTYCPESLRQEGFIHCSDLGQVIPVANTFYRGQQDLVLIAIDPSKATAKVVYEGPDEGEDRFPHIYGPLNVKEVIEAYDLEPGTDGLFELPDQLDSAL